ncbi:putative heterokaryon incompatibility protein [Rosellinia necatrix]|uniref:Putative heterokaryon incompatibility protein n=1 Tax=Rosellinia necatrix TaxID=77044 RepID=A0A1W2TJ36_ROSNE|nr:putative heterokaryon incompatibility protein [Rosellinia necatrix]
MAYRHRALSGPRETRLLILHPAESAASPLCGSLVECHIEEPRNGSDAQAATRYEALSYVWGLPSQAHSIDIDSSALPITANCDAALRQLRCTSESRVLWVDSICIDQTPEGVLERNSQVAMMGDIYEGAVDVLAWLGEGDEKTEALFLHLARIYALRDDADEDARAEANAQFMRECDAKYLSSKPTVVTEIIESVLGRPWFERMWTLQELLLASHATVLCGHQAMEWQIFCRALELAETSFDPWSKGSRNFINCYYAYSDYKDLISEDTGTLAAEKVENHSMSQQGLSTMMHHTRIRYASDLRDKVFALHGVSRKLGKPFPTPDYTDPIPVIYARATVAVIQLDASLWPLDHVWSDTRRTDLPSWVPDWSVDPRWSEEFFGTLGCLPVDHAYRGADAHWDGPVDQRRPSTKADEYFSLLTVKGRVYGTIDAAVDDQERVEIQRDLMAMAPQSVEYELATRRHGAQRIKYLRRFYTHLAARDTPENPIFLTFCRLLLAYAPTQHLRSFETGSADFRALLDAADPPDGEFSRILRKYAVGRLEDASDRNQRHADVLALVESDVDATLDVLLSPSVGGDVMRSSVGKEEKRLFRLVAPAMGFYRIVQGLSINRTMFTSNGGLIGYADGRLQQGDLVVKFQGATTSHVLRASGDVDGRYQLCSPAVVKAACSMEDLADERGDREFILA